MNAVTLALALLCALLTPCASEDAHNCHWSAETAGNGHGTSFIDIDGTAYYLTEGNPS